MSHLEMWSLIVGFLLPPALSVVQQTHWTSAIRAVVAFVACLIAAAITLVVQQDGHWNWHQWLGNALLVFVTAITTYKRFWVPTHISPAIEGRTNVYKEERTTAT